MNQLLLFRHAAAHPAAPLPLAVDGPADADARRGLTSRGRRCFGRLVEGLARDGVEVDVVFHSPRRRATETAELLRPIVRGRWEVMAALAAPPDPALVLALSGERVAVVGHQPWLGDLLGLLTGAPPSVVRWRKGGLVHLRRDTDGAPWQIVAVQAPPRRR